MRASETHCACRNDVLILSFVYVCVLVQEFVLEDRHTISGLETLSRVCAGITQQKTFELDNGLSGRWLLIVFMNILCQIRDINACIALSCNIEVIFFQSRELYKELEQCLQVVLSHSAIIEFLGLTHTESDLDNARCTP